MESVPRASPLPCYEPVETSVVVGSTIFIFHGALLKNYSIRICIWLQKGGKLDVFEFRNVYVLHQ